MGVERQKQGWMAALRASPAVMVGERVAPRARNEFTEAALEVVLSVSRTLLQVGLITAAASLLTLSSSEAQVSACAAPDKQTACAVLCCGRSPCAPSCQSDCVRPCVEACSSAPGQQAFGARLSQLQARCGYSTAPRRVK